VRDFDSDSKLEVVDSEHVLAISEYYTDDYDFEKIKLQLVKLDLARLEYTVLDTKEFQNSVEAPLFDARNRHKFLFQFKQIYNYDCFYECCLVNSRISFKIVRASKTHSYELVKFEGKRLWIKEKFTE
jgi:hypothetical protein